MMYCSLKIGATGLFPCCSVMISFRSVLFVLSVCGGLHHGSGMHPTENFISLALLLARSCHRRILVRVLDLLVPTAAAIALLFDCR